MTIITRFADWVCGADRHAAELAEEMAHLREMLNIKGDTITIAKDRIALLETQSRALAAQCYELQHRLNLIAAEERPTSNATVRRMARIARGEV